MNIANTIVDYFWSILEPRDRGSILVARFKPGSSLPGIGVWCGYDGIIEMRVDDGNIRLSISYPNSLVNCVRTSYYGSVDLAWVWQKRADCEEPKQLPKNLRLRRRLANQLFAGTQTRRYHLFELAEPDSMRRLEFIVQTTVSRMKALRADIADLPAGHQFIDPYQLATEDYERKILGPIEKKKERINHERNIHQENPLPGLQHDLRRPRGGH